jgi:starvation-inducible DNA-binding protein
MKSTKPKPPVTDIQDRGLVYQTGNDISLPRRRELIPLLNLRLADAIDLQLQMKQAHWNVKGPTFIALHGLFDRIDEEVRAFADLLAERLVQLGGTAEGTVRLAASRTRLAEYPLGLHTEKAHLETVARALSTFGSEVRASIEQANELGDVDSADVFTEISRGTDKWLWMVEAHFQGPQQ